MNLNDPRKIKRITRKQLEGLILTNVEAPLIPFMEHAAITRSLRPTTNNLRKGREITFCYANYYTTSLGLANRYVFMAPFRELFYMNSLVSCLRLHTKNIYCC